MNGELCIIFGQGHHSADHEAKIKPAVYAMLRERGFHFTPDLPNPGCARDDTRCCLTCPPQLSGEMST